MKAANSDLGDIVRSTLEACRVEAVKRLSGAGLPMTVMTQQTIAENHGAESSAHWDEREVSSLNDFGVMIKFRRDKSAGGSLLGMKEQLDELSTHIDSVSSLGTKRQYGFFPNATGSEGVLLRVVEPLALYYLTTSNPGIPDPELAQQLVSEIEKLVNKPHPQTTYQLALSGVEVRGDFAHENVRIRAMTPEEMGAFFDLNSQDLKVTRDQTGIGVVVPGRFNEFLPTVVLEVTGKDSGIGDQESLFGSVRSMVMALYLGGIDVSSSGVAVHFETPRWLNRSYASIPFPVEPRRMPGFKILNKTKFRELVELSKKIPNFMLHENSREEIVFHRVFLGLASKQGSFLDFVVALEAALLQGVKSELRYRFSLYGALYLADEFVPKETFSRLKKVYDLRSDLVHGNAIKQKDRHAVEVDAEVFAKAVALRILHEGWPEADQLNDRALGETISKS